MAAKEIGSEKTKEAGKEKEKGRWEDEEWANGQEQSPVRALSPE